MLDIALIASYVLLLLLFIIFEAIIYPLLVEE